MSNSDADWLPLESSPEQLNHLLAKFQKVPASLGFTDIYSLDDLDVLFPFPVYACLLLYPITPSSSDNQASGQVSSSDVSDVKGVEFIKQYVGNACGTIAVLHSLLNTQKLLDNSVSEIQHLRSITSGHDRGMYIQKEPLFKQVHAESLNVSSQRQVTEADSDTMLHFVCFVNDSTGENIIELDGRFEGPKMIKSGTSKESLLHDVCEHVKERISSDPSGSLEFTLLALVDKENCMD